MLMSHLEAHAAAMLLASLLAGCATPPCKPPEPSDLMVDERTGAYIVSDEVLRLRGVDRQCKAR